MGHQLWHSFPIVVQLTRAMLGDPKSGDSGNTPS
jgi:hypothetical protein